MTRSYPIGHGRLVIVEAVEAAPRSRSQWDRFLACLADRARRPRGTRRISYERLVLALGAWILFVSLLYRSVAPWWSALP